MKETGEAKLREFKSTTGCQSIMVDRPRIECDIHDLLEEANVLMLSPQVDVRDNATLIGKLRNCADQAQETGLADSAQRMQQVADTLQQRLLHQ